MSDLSTAPTVPAVTTEVLEFADGEVKGFKFNVPVYNDIDEVVKTYGKDSILDIVNSSVAARIRTKVKNGLGLEKLAPHLRPAVVQQKLVSTGGLLFSPTDAISWRPDIREISGKQMFKRANEMLSKDYPILLAQGKTAEAEAKKQEAVVLMQRAMARVMAEASEATAPAATT